ncbi:unnamed protein product [Meganyctiphanes norvegica]|uniref:C2H2-type domain-containing protein n=1 Tax=Meganyctiphanes norvegica TaxID=48144 RepID=A0AAV2SJI0_MEGNR
MSESVSNNECAAKFAQGNSLHNIANGNMDSGNIVKSDESYHQEILRKSVHGIVGVKIKEEIEVKEESINNQAVDINLKKENKIYEDYCDKAFSRSFQLKNHRMTHSGEKPYQCSHCDKAFSENSNLKVHQRMHTGEKPYRCSHQCDKAFSQKNVLITHQRTHTGEKPYQCTQ